MMRGIVIALALVMALGTATYADTADIYVKEGWNLISVPLVPTSQDPYTIFAAAPSGIDFQLFNWDPSKGGDSFQGDAAAFGGILLGDGYWLNVNPGDGTAHLTFDGLADGVPGTDGAMTDMWVSLPGNQKDAYTVPDPAGDPTKNGGGWHMIGCPYNHPVCVNKVDGNGDESYLGDRIMFTDGTQVLNWNDAYNAGWVDYKISGFDATTGGFDVQFDGGGLTTNLEPGRGYWLNTYKDNIAMIILASN